MKPFSKVSFDEQRKHMDAMFGTPLSRWPETKIVLYVRGDGEDVQVANQNGIEHLIAAQPDMAIIYWQGKEYDDDDTGQKR